MPNDDSRPGIDWGKYRTLKLERRDDGILLVTIAEPEGYPAASLARRHTEVSWIWRDFDDDPDMRVAVITGRGERFWTVEGNEGVNEMLENPGNYNAIVNLIREGLVNAHGIVDCDKPIVSAINGEAMGSGLAVGLLADISVASADARLIDGDRHHPGRGRDADVADGARGRRHALGAEPVRSGQRTNCSPYERMDSPQSTADKAKGSTPDP